jgi:hypothetical protein
MVHVMELFGSPFSEPTAGKVLRLRPCLDSGGPGTKGHLTGPSTMLRIVEDVTFIGNNLLKTIISPLYNGRAVLHGHSVMRPELIISANLFIVRHSFFATVD